MNPADLSQQSFSGLNQQANSIEKADVIAAALQTCLDFNYPIYESALSVPCPRDDTVAILGAISSLKKSGKIEGYVDEVIPRYSDVDFKSHFRLSRCTVQILMEKLPHRQEATTGRPSLYISRPDVVVLMSLWTLGTQESFREVADRFGLGKGHAYRAFTVFCGDLCSLRGEIICWPQGEAAFKCIRDFSSLRELSFPDVIGCVDGAHISMSSPKDEKTAYFNRKQYTSMLLQGVCDADMKFIDVFAGWPGSSHDARVWNNSPLLCAIQANPALIPEGAHILGDCAYPLSRHLMTPFKDNGHLTHKQRHFNKILSSTRVVIEQAFGQLFGRFRRLRHLLMFRMDRIPEIIISGCILHNMCLSEGDEMPAPDPDDDDSNDWNFNNIDDNSGCNLSAATKRNRIADYLMSIRQ